MTEAMTTNLSSAAPVDRWKAIFQGFPNVHLEAFPRLNIALQLPFRHFALVWQLQR